MLSIALKLYRSLWLERACLGKLAAGEELSSFGYFTCRFVSFLSLSGDSPVHHSSPQPSWLCLAGWPSVWRPGEGMGAGTEVRGCCTARLL